MGGVYHVTLVPKRLEPLDWWASKLEFSSGSALHRGCFHCGDTGQSLFSGSPCRVEFPAPAGPPPHLAQTFLRCQTFQWHCVEIICSISPLLAQVFLTHQCCLIFIAIFNCSFHCSLLFYYFVVNCLGGSFGCQKGKL